MHRLMNFNSLVIVVFLYTFLNHELSKGRVLPQTERRDSDCSSINCTLHSCPGAFIPEGECCLTCPEEGTCECRDSNGICSKQVQCPVNPCSLDNGGCGDKICQTDYCGGCNVRCTIVNNCSSVRCGLLEDCDIENASIPKDGCCPKCPDSSLDCRLVDCVKQDCEGAFIPDGACCSICPKEAICECRDSFGTCDTLVQCFVDPCILNNGGCGDKICQADYCGGCNTRCTVDDCSLVKCEPLFECNIKESYIPHNECCPICPNSSIDCHLVDCAKPDCENAFVPKGQCCQLCPEELPYTF